MGGIVPGFGATGQSIYGAINSMADASAWNGVSLEAWNIAHWATYVVATPEQAGSGRYIMTVPAALPAGRYIATFYLQLGGSPASGDSPISTQAFDWDGTNVLGQGSGMNVTQINGSAPAAANLSTSAKTFVTGAAAAGTLSAAQMTTNLGGTVANMYAGRVLYFTTGLNAGIAVLITAYAVTGGKLTFVAYNNTTLPVAPSVGDAFVIF